MLIEKLKRMRVSKLKDLGGGMDGVRLFLLAASFGIVSLSRSQKSSELIDGRERDGSDIRETLSISSEYSES